MWLLWAGYAFIACRPETGRSIHRVARVVVAVSDSSPLGVGFGVMKDQPLPRALGGHPTLKVAIAGLS